MLPRAQIRSDKLYCFTILTLLRLKKKKKRLATKKTREIWRKGKREKKSLQVVIQGRDRVSTAGHHHPLPNLDHQNWHW